MGSRQIFFLPETPAGSTQRDLELKRSAAKAHAARASARLRKGRGKTKVVFQQHGRKSSKRALDQPSTEQPLTPRPLSPGLMTILRKGNSDPFDMLAVPITARVNRILAFFKDGYLPMVYRVRIRSEQPSGNESALEQEA